MDSLVSGPPVVKIEAVFVEVVLCGRPVACGKEVLEDEDLGRLVATFHLLDGGGHLARSSSGTLVPGATEN